MRTVWKWVIGVAIVLVVVAAVVAGAFVLRSQFARLPRVGQVAPQQQGTPVPNQPVPGQRGPYGFRPYQGPGFTMPYGGRGYPMMGRRGFGFSPFIGLFGGLLFLGFVALLVVAIVLLVRRSRTPMAAATVPASMVAPAAPAAPMAEAMGTHACKNCGEPVQDGFKHCPNCGAAQ